MPKSRCPGPTSCARYMRRTSLSENQYDTKFMTPATIRPISIPFVPPNAWPSARSSPLSRPSNNAVFRPLGISRLYPVMAGFRGRLHRCHAPEQPGDERAAPGQRRHVDVLVRGVRAVADRAEAVERRHAKSGGESFAPAPPPPPLPPPPPPRGGAPAPAGTNPPAPPAA